MSIIKTDLGYIYGAENLVDWVNQNANAHQIKNHSDLHYWLRLARQKRSEGSRCLYLGQAESKDGKSHMLPFYINRDGVTFHGIYH